jgi:hypothetical protein
MSAKEQGCGGSKESCQGREANRVPCRRPRQPAGDGGCPRSAEQQGTLLQFGDAARTSPCGLRHPKKPSSHHLTWSSSSPSIANPNVAVQQEAVHNDTQFASDPASQPPRLQARSPRAGRPRSASDGLEDPIETEKHHPWGDSGIVYKCQAATTFCLTPNLTSQLKPCSGVIVQRKSR